MKIAIVTSDLMGPIQNGGVGSACYLLAKNMAADQHQVTVFLSGRHFFFNKAILYWRLFYEELGIKIELVGESAVPLQHGNAYARAAMEVYLRLRDSDFNLILFQDMHALGHYCLLAKKTGLELQNTKLWVMFHGPSNWHLSESSGLPSHLAQLALHVMEKESCLNADRLLFSTKYAKQIAHKYGYASPEQETSVELFPFEEKISRRKIRKTALREICFFGRLESRKGLEVFLAAIEKIIPILIEKQIKVSLLGRMGFIKGADAQEFIDQWRQRNSFHLDILANKNREESLSYLMERDVLAVLPSKDETMGYTLVECLQNSIPFICSDIKPFLEVCEKFAANPVPSFRSGDFSDLEKKLTDKIYKGIAPVRCDSTKFDENIINWKSVFEAKEPVSSKKIKKTNLDKAISLCIPHRNHAKYLALILRAIQDLDDFPLEVLIYDDESDSSNLLRLKKAIAKQSKLKFPIQVIYGKKRIGVSAARNILAEQARGEYIYFLDADNLPTTGLFRDLTTIINKNSPDIITSTMCRFDFSSALLTSEPDEDSRKDLYFFISNDLSINFFQNMAGDANFCVRREYFLKIGGFDQNLNSREDQEFFVRATVNNARFLYCPKPLFFYRVHDSNSSHFLDAHNSFGSIRDTFGGSLFHAGFNELMKMFTAWAYSRESFLARGSEISISSQLPTISPIELLSSGEISILSRLQKKVSNKSKLGSFSLRLTTSKNPVGKVELDSKNGVINLMVLSPKRFFVQFAEDLPKIKIEIGTNLIKLPIPKKGKLSFCNPEDDIEIFVLLYKPWHLKSIDGSFAKFDRAI